VQKLSATATPLLKRLVEELIKTPKPMENQAKILIDKFKNIEVTVFGCGEGNKCVVSGKMMEMAAKQCALLCVDEIVKYNGNKEYWGKLKETINQTK